MADFDLGNIKILEAMSIEEYYQHLQGFIALKDKINKQLEKDIKK